MRNISSPLESVAPIILSGCRPLPKPRAFSPWRPKTYRWNQREWWPSVAITQLTLAGRLLRPSLVCFVCLPPPSSSCSPVPRSLLKPRWRLSFCPLSFFLPSLCVSAWTRRSGPDSPSSLRAPTCYPRCRMRSQLAPLFTLVILKISCWVIKKNKQTSF